MKEKEKEKEANREPRDSSGYLARDRRRAFRELYFWRDVYADKLERVGKTIELWYR